MKKNYKSDRRSSSKYKSKKNFNKPKVEKIPENLENITFDYVDFPFKFNLFGKIKYNKKDILKTFGLYYKTKKEHTRFNLYYSDSFIKEISKLFKYLFDDFDKVTKSDLYYMKNCKKVKIPITFSEKDVIYKEVKYELIKIIEKNKINYKINLNISDIFSVLKLYSGKNLYDSYSKQPEAEYRDVYYEFINHKLKGFICEYNLISFGYFINYKPDVRDYARLMANKIVKNCKDYDEELINTVRNMFKRVKIIKFKIFE